MEAAGKVRVTCACEVPLNHSVQQRKQHTQHKINPQAQYNTPVLRAHCPCRTVQRAGRLTPYTMATVLLMANMMKRGAQKTEQVSSRFVTHLVPSNWR